MKEATLALYHPCVIHVHFLIFDKPHFVVYVDLSVILLFPKKEATNNHSIEELIDEEDASRSKYHPLIKARKCSTPVPDDRLDEVSLSCLCFCVIVSK